MTTDTDVRKDVKPSQDSANTENTCDARYHLSGDMSVNLMYAEQALRDYNEDAKKGKCPPLFFQDDKLVLVSPDDEGNPTVKEVDPAKLTLLLTQCGTWSGGKRSTKDKGGYHQKHNRLCRGVQEDEDFPQERKHILQ